MTLDTLSVLVKIAHPQELEALVWLKAHRRGGALKSERFHYMTILYDFIGQRPHLLRPAIYDVIDAPSVPVVTIASCSTIPAIVDAYEEYIGLGLGDGFPGFSGFPPQTPPPPQQ